jgi:hypothetical protein
MIRHAPVKSRVCHRRAIILAGLLVCLVVVALLMGSLTRLLIRNRRQSELFQRSLQSMLLVEAGLQRAMIQLSGDPDYRGEEWQIPATAMGQTWPATVEIVVQSGAHPTDPLRIRATARYPAATLDPVIRTREKYIPPVGKGRE